jgi:hypothetical protein
MRTAAREQDPDRRDVPWPENETSVARTTDDPGFRLWQRMWRIRAEASRRLAPYDDEGRVDPLAPFRRWGE